MQQPRLPAALLIGLVFGWMGRATRAWSSIAIELRGAKDFDVDFSQMMRWEMFGYGASLAGTLLVTGALFGLANRLTGRHRVMFLVAAWVFVVSLVFEVAWPLIDMLNPRESYREVLEYVWRSFGAVNLGAMVLIGIGSRAWSRSALTIVAAVAAIVAALFGAWLPYFGKWLFDTLWEDHRILHELYYPIRELVWSGAILVMVHAMMRDVAAPLPDQRIGAVGLRTAGGALIGRVLAALALALMGMGMVKTLGAVKMMLVLAPTIAVLTTLVFAGGLVAVDRANLEGMPRVRLLLGAAISAWSGGVQLLQTSRMREDFFKDSADHWVFLNPIFATVGIALVISAIHSFAITRGNERLRLAAGSRATLFIIMSVIAVGAPFLLLGTREPSSLMMVVVLAAVCGIVGLIAVACLMALTADELGTTPELPRARLHK